jgi:putative hydrolase of the HAD superfamily
VPPYNPVVTTARHIHQTLLFDADDTLWENNIYFERAIASFITYLDHKVHTASEVRERLNACEHATIAVYGYGLKSFQRSLVDCFEQLSAIPVTPAIHARIVSFTEAISGTEIELIAGVDQTLRELHQRHRLILVTKGNVEEQTDKLERSGLRNLFAAVEVLAEKNVSAYRELIVRHSFEQASTWMIGNSPKSDMNPSLAAGLHAVFIPHDHTWVLEHEVVDQPNDAERLLRLGTFSDLLLYF